MRWHSSHTISSDIYCRNRIDGPVRSLALVMSKFLAIGMTLPQVIDCVTVSAAEAGCACRVKGGWKWLRRRFNAIRLEQIGPRCWWMLRREPAG